MMIIVGLGLIQNSWITFCITFCITFFNNYITCLNQLKQFSSPIGHELATANIVSLSSAYNDLATIVIYNNKIYSNDINNNYPINILEFDNEFNDSVNYIINKPYNEAMLNIAMNNSALYNSDLEINSGNKYNWGGNTVYEVSNSFLSKFAKDKNSFSSKNEFTSNFIANADGASYITLKQSY
ncbi:hypothetical protein LY90DRAFT_517132 [Neocallimastix californiae]|uniref:Uncharacterized protein n=1 Tax=Neocallimastix californiae TaxID=1754190 RepID=A0A1Y2ABX7_9FUNG|nr:hypothetical protein LY90DRAFT_517132 [Neocallimastix californiae]|eukprot:ORY20038.1 hypothetical protein LY90DRAFT_517132 [Neocallimastix californiae]